MTEREYREIHDRYAAEIAALREQVRMLMDPLVQVKMLQPPAPVIFQLTDGETWNLVIEKALNAAYDSEDLSEAISKIKALKR